jgi:transposase
MKRKYDAEFKRNTVQKVFDGQSVASVSRELGVGEGLIHKWKRAALENGNGKQSGFEVSENLALKKRVRELEQENEILKKAALIFGRGN